MREFWSSSDFAYMCLLDRSRTLLFRDALMRVVKAGDTVIDVGSGTGILALFAAEAGAGRVIAVEADTVLAEWTRQTVALNDLSDRIEVLAGNVYDMPLPPADVVVAELVSTALIEETLVPVLNSLRTRGVIHEATKIVPGGYETSAQLVSIDHSMYGYKFLTLRHEWPFYSTDETWQAVDTVACGPLARVWSGRVDGGEIEERVEAVIALDVDEPVEVNGVRLGGRAELSTGLWAGPSNTFCGDKVLPMSPRRVNRSAMLSIRYQMGAGLKDLHVDWAD